MSRTVRPALPVVSTDGRADARGSVTVSTDIARATLAALAGLTPHPWLGVIDEGSGWIEADLSPARSLREALVGVPATPEAIIAAVDAREARGDFANGEGELRFWRPDVSRLGGARYEWTPRNGGERNIIIHFRESDAVLSWRSDVAVYRNYERVGANPHRSRFIGRVVAWASPRSVAVAPMAGNSGPIRSF
jgi:hypothetical protein